MLFESPSVRARVIDGRAVLLDLREGTYVVFDAVATTMWDALVHVPPESQLAVLAERLDAPPERLAADLGAFRDSCIERGFLVTDRPAPYVSTLARGKPPSAGWTLLAWRSLAETSLALRTSGFPDVYRRYRAIPKPVNASCDREALERAERAFLRAENFFALRSAPKDCLPRSLALYRFLLAVGFAPEHRIGVQRFHFEAHGWVWCAGGPVLDTPQFVARYTDLAVL